LVLKNETLSVLFDLLSWTKENNYAGWNKYDALDSPVLKKLSFNNKWLRLIYSQVIMRSPINIRPIFLIKKRRNPKGIALFAESYLNLIKMTGGGERKKYIDEAKELLNWLLENHSVGFKGICWGYQYPWQDIGFYAPAGFPNRVVTFFCARALLGGYEFFREKKYLEAVKDSLKFMLEEPKILFENNEMKCLSYVPDRNIKIMVMDVSAYVGALLARVYFYTKEEKLKVESRKLINFVIDKQTKYGAWFYTHPAQDSHLTHDNYHTGAILDSILDYMEFTGDRQYEDNYYRGLDFYAQHLFLENGAPKFMWNKVYPLDIHSAASGIITFSRAGKIDRKYKKKAEKILNWTISNLYDRKKRCFYYQQLKYFTKKFTLMRWCNAWMSKAISEFLLREEGNGYN
jgi:hypothetical protein